MQKADPEMTSLNKFVESGSKPFRGEISSIVLGKIYDHLSFQMTFYRGKSIFLFSSSFTIEHIHTLNSYKNKIVRNILHMALYTKKLILIITHVKSRFKENNKKTTQITQLHNYSLLSQKLFHSFPLYTKFIYSRISNWHTLHI